MGIEILIGVALAIATLALLSIFRRERLRGDSSSTHPLLVGIYRGCAAVIIVYVTVAVLAAVVSALTYRAPLMP